MNPYNPPERQIGNALATLVPIAIYLVFLLACEIIGFELS